MDNTPPDWAMKEARRRIAASYNGDLPVGHGKTDPSGIAYNPSVVKPLAEMIAKHEQAPDDPDEVVVNDIISAYNGITHTIHYRKSQVHDRFKAALTVYRKAKERSDAS